MNFNVIIPAAGSGRRMRSQDLPKQFLSMADMPMVYHSIKAFAGMRGVKKIIVATQRSFFPEFSKEKMEVLGFKNVTVVEGGKERVDSVRCALKKVDKDADLVIIHDAARPFIQHKDIERVIAAAKKSGAAILARSVVPTVKQVLRNGKIVSTVDRTTLRHAETPQVFKRDCIVSAHKKYAKGEIKGAVTDDAYLVEQCGGVVTCVNALSPNTKITDQSDLQLLQQGEKGMDIRIGSGFDTHRLITGRALYLGGIKIPFPKGCLGHSDGDVLIHAIIDALLGAVGTKDIGEYFPNTSKKYKDISSLDLLKKTSGIIAKKKHEIGNIDTTVICEKPQIAKYKKEMLKKITDALGIEKNKLSIKGKTKEGLDSEGQGFSISAHAVALLFKK